MSSTNSTPDIDIYDCPLRASASGLNFPLSYMIAIMQAAADGKPLQAWNGHEWKAVSLPRWNWSESSYRIDPASRPQPAPSFKVGDYVAHSGGYWLGDLYISVIDEIQPTCPRSPCNIRLDANTATYWNPDVLRHASNDEIRKHLIDQAAKGGFKVGANVSYRRRIPNDIQTGPPETISSVAVWLPGDPCTWGCGSYMWDSTGAGKPFAYVATMLMHAIPIEYCHLAAPTKIKVPLTPNDLTGSALWFRWSTSSPRGHTLVTSVHDDGIDIADDHHRLFSWLAMTGCQWSNDRVVWRPFWKEIES